MYISLAHTFLKQLHFLTSLLLHPQPFYPSGGRTSSHTSYKRTHTSTRLFDNTAYHSMTLISEVTRDGYTHGSSLVFPSQDSVDRRLDVIYAFEFDGVYNLRPLFGWSQFIIFIQTKVSPPSRFTHSTGRGVCTFFVFICCSWGLLDFKCVGNINWVRKFMDKELDKHALK